MLNHDTRFPTCNGSNALDWNIGIVIPQHGNVFSNEMPCAGIAGALAKMVHCDFLNMIWHQNLRVHDEGELFGLS